MHQVTGQLLYAGYAYDEGLMLDLYGLVDDDGYYVESIAVACTTVEIAQLFNARQIENMGMWLALKDGSPSASGQSAISTTQRRTTVDGVTVGIEWGSSATRQPIHYPQHCHPGI